MLRLKEIDIYKLIVATNATIGTMARLVALALGKHFSCCVEYCDWHHSDFIHMSIEAKVPTRYGLVTVQHVVHMYCILESLVIDESMRRPKVRLLCCDPMLLDNVGSVIRADLMRKASRLIPEKLKRKRYLSLLFRKIVSHFLYFNSRRNL